MSDGEVGFHDLGLIVGRLPAGAAFEDFVVEPSLPFFDIKLAMVDGEPDISRLMRWNYRLVEKLRGREKEFGDICDWAESDDQRALVRLVEGPGGAGKTRLAAEAALTLRAKGWAAGFMPRSALAAYRPSEKGLFLIMDYPEENPERLDAIVRDLADHAKLPYKLRLLLLSRQRYEGWSRIFAPIADRVGRQSIARLGPLPIEEAHGLALEAANRMAALMKRPYVDDIAGLREWLAENDDNRLSLYATAAAIHFALAPMDAFGLHGHGVIEDLALREMARLFAAGEMNRLGRNALPRVLALATVAGKITAPVLERLAQPDMQIFECPPDEVLARLKTLPWWDEEAEAVPALSPDILAATVTNRVLKERSDMAPGWLWAVLKDAAGHDLAARLGRIVYDMDLVAREPTSLPIWLERMIGEDPARAATFAAITLDNHLPHRLASFSAAVGLALAAGSEGEDQAALVLVNASMDLAAAGKERDALEAAQRARLLYERLAAIDPDRYEPALAGCLNNLSNRLSEMGDWNGALEAASSAVSIWERLVYAHPKFDERLASSLNNLATQLGETGRLQEAMEAAQRAVNIRERLVDAAPEHFEPDLARSLNNLAYLLQEAGDTETALYTAQRAVEIRERLAAADPARFSPELASSLNVLASMQSNDGDVMTAVQTARRATQIYETLAAANPARFEHSLAGSLNNLANRLWDVGALSDAVKAVKIATDINMRLAAQQPARFEPDLAMSLHNLASHLGAQGDTVGALKASAQAVDIYSRLTSVSPERFLSALAPSLMLAATTAERGGEREKARHYLDQAMAIYRAVARATPRDQAARVLRPLSDGEKLYRALGMDSEADGLATEIANLSDSQESWEQEARA